MSFGDDDDDDDVWEFVCGGNKMGSCEGGKDVRRCVRSFVSAIGDRV